MLNRYIHRDSPRLRIIRFNSVFIACGLLISTWCHGDATAPRITAETLVRYLQQDLFLSPGIGFKKVQIGVTFSQVKANWGLPNKTNGGASNTRLDSGADEKRQWTYVAGRDTSVKVSGDTRVREIEIIGSLTTPFFSSQGASFGMTPHQVISIYGPPTNKGNLKEILYDARGIAFGFQLGGLVRMRVFSPGRFSSTNSNRQPVK